MQIDASAREREGGMCARAIALLLVLSATARLADAAAADGRTGGLFGGCVGDCNDDVQVTVDEIILAVRITLGDAPESACPNGGQGYSINGLTTAVLNTLEGCVALRDFSAFTEFAVNQSSALGFCPEVGDVYAASIRPGQGGMVLARTLVERGTAGVDPCLEGVFRSDCLVARAEPCRRLTAAELERVRGAFAQVKVWTAPDAFCIHGVADPCLITTMHWDDSVTSDFIHGYARLDDGEVPRIGELIRSLGEGPETPCPEP